MNVPKSAECVATAVDDGRAFGIWKDEAGVLYVAGYHFGPSGDVLFRIELDGEVLGTDELEATE